MNQVIDDEIDDTEDQDLDESLEELNDDNDDDEKPKKGGARSKSGVTTQDLYKMYLDDSFPEEYKKYKVPLNARIDAVSNNGVITERWHRECLKCDDFFIGVGKFVRSCDKCRGGD